MKRKIDCQFPKLHYNQEDSFRAIFGFLRSSKTNTIPNQDSDYPGELYEKDFEQFDIFWREKGYFGLD